MSTILTIFVPILDVFVLNPDTITGQGISSRKIFIQFYINFVCHMGAHKTSTICTALHHILTCNKNEYQEHFLGVKAADA